MLFLCALGCKIKENKTILRIYGFEGDAAGQGEVFTCTQESKRSRQPDLTATLGESVAISLRARVIVVIAGQCEQVVQEFC